ncbi:MAG TPA: cytochrome c oxidase subunit II [Solirubrobacterales bacterium]|nr:cytochrome c oxidase subunit II [Solirubrobacterales bacterium]
MSPASPGSDQIDTLLWIGFVVAAILVVAVNGALIYAARRYRGGRGTEPREAGNGRATQLRVAGVLTAFAAAVFVLGVVYTEDAREVPATGADGLQVAHSEPLKIQTTGQQWLWRYDYPNGSFSYYKLVVPVDTTVELELDSTDVIHTWDVPELAAKHDAVPGKTSAVVFRAEREGVYRGQSATFSGQAYGAMRTEVEVVSPEEYESFVETRKADIQAAQDRVVGLIEAGTEP